MTGYLYQFEWDSGKARANFAKHRVDFEQATEVFRDPLALTISDEEHTLTEVRWITLRREANGQYSLVVHTFMQVNDDMGRIRMISARRPTRAEIQFYEEQI